MENVSEGTLTIDQLESGQILECITQFTCVADYGDEFTFGPGDRIRVSSTNASEVEVEIGDEYTHLTQEDIENFKIADNQSGATAKITADFRHELEGLNDPNDEDFDQE